MRRCLAPLAIALIVVNVASALPVRGQEPAAFAFHHSRQFGVVIWWDPNRWTVVDQIVEPRYEFLSLESDEGFVYYMAYAEPGITARKCVEDWLGDLHSDPAASDIVLNVSDHAGDFRLALSEAQFTYRYDFGEDEPLYLRQSVACELIAATEAVLRTGAQDFTADQSSNLVADQLDQVRFLSAEPFANAGHDADQRWQTVPYLTRFAIDDEAGFFEPESEVIATVEFVERIDAAASTAAGLPAAPTGRHYARMAIHIVNASTDPEPVIVDAARFYVVDGTAVVHQPRHVVWEEGPADSDQEQVALSSGDVARLQLYFLLGNVSPVASIACRCDRTYQSSPWSPAPPGDVRQTGQSPSLFHTLVNRSGRRIVEFITLEFATTADTDGRVVLIHNVSANPFTVDPALFQTIGLVAADPAGSPQPAVLRPIDAYAWLDGAGVAGDGAPRTIPPGEVAMVEIHATGALSYFVRPNQPISIR